MNFDTEMMFFGNVFLPEDIFSVCLLYPDAEMMFFLSDAWPEDILTAWLLYRTEGKVNFKGKAVGGGMFAYDDSCACLCSDMGKSNHAQNQSPVRPFSWQFVLVTMNCVGGACG